MFATATRNFVEEVDPDGGLIPVSSLKDSISVLSVVVKRKRFWLWQKPKYIPTDFKLNDLLTGDEPLTPGEMKRPCSVFQGGSSLMQYQSLSYSPGTDTLQQRVYPDLCQWGKVRPYFCSTAFHKVHAGDPRFVMSGSLTLATS